MRQLLIAVALVVSSESALAGLVDKFVIGLEQQVSNGVPARGAGNIELAGASDVYTFTLAAPTTIFFDEQGSGCAIQWHCDGPSGVVFPLQPFCVNDPDPMTLESGDYTITVNAGGANTGTYAFTLWDVEPPQVFAIGLKQQVANGSPGIGAGVLEEPGAIDVYTLEVARPTDVYIDEQSGGCGLFWEASGPSGSLFASQPICVNDPGVFSLAAGTYTFTVSGSDSNIGSYSFEIWALNPPQLFFVEVGQTISQNVPARGAGLIEEPGAIDVYALDLRVPTTVYFNEISGGCGLFWKCDGPNGAIFALQPICVTDPGSFALLDVGTYTMTVSGSQSNIGAYSFELVELAPPQIFDIALGDIVSLDVPAVGAGNIEEPGSIDVYHLPLRAGDEICFDELEASTCALVWRVVAPDGAVVFTNDALCITDPASFLVPTTGTCMITVNGMGSAVGTYSFTTRVRPAADLDGSCHVDASDLAIFLGAWGACAGCAADLDGNGSVDASDLAILLGAWG